MPDEKVQRQAPDVLAMVLADGILRDMASGKFYIQGTYSIVSVPEFPWRHGPIMVYIAITNGHGKTPMKVRIVDVDDEREPLLEANSEMEFADPLQVVEVVIGCPPIVFPEPGEYRLQLYGAGEFLRERRLQVIPIPQPPHTDNKPPE
jgi:uncharacterized protein DUF6941